MNNVLLQLAGDKTDWLSTLEIEWTETGNWFSSLWAWASFSLLSAWVCFFFTNCMEMMSRKSVQLLSLVFSWGKYLVKTLTQCLLRSVSSGCRGNVPLPLRRGLSSSLQTNKEGPGPWPRQHCQPSRGQTLDGSTIDSLWLGSLWPGWRGHCHRERSETIIVLKTSIFKYFRAWSSRRSHDETRYIRTKATRNPSNIKT